MSRTRHRTKPAGYDFWSRRPGNRGGGGFGPVTKWITRTRERAAERAVVKAETLAALEEIGDETTGVTPCA